MLVLTTPTNPGAASWTPGSGLGGLRLTSINTAFNPATDTRIGCLTGAGAIDVALPAAGSVAPGVAVEIKNVNALNNVTVTPAGLDTVDLVPGVFSFAASLGPGQTAALFVSDGVSNWILFENYVLPGGGGGGGPWVQVGPIVSLVVPGSQVGIGAVPAPGTLLSVGGNTKIDGKLTVTGDIDPTAVLLSDPLLGTALYFDSAPGQTAPNAPANHGRIRYNNITKQWEGSVDTGPYTPFGGTSTGPSAILISVTATAGTFDSIALIPAGNRITGAQVEILTVYDGAATITVGTPATPTAFQTTSDNIPDATGIYLRQQDTLQALASVVRVTLGGVPTVGSAQVLISYTPVLL